MTDEMTKAETRKMIEKAMSRYEGSVTRISTVLGKGLLSSNTAVPRSSSSKMRLGKLSGGKMFTAESGMKLKVV